MMKRYLTILLISLLTISLSGCHEEMKNELRQECYKVEKVYPTRNIEELNDKFPNGYRLNQLYETEDFSYSLKLRKEYKEPLKGILKSDREYEVVYADSTFKCDAPFFLGKFLFQEIALNKEILSKQKEKIEYNWIEGTGGSILYEMSDSIINQFFHKDLKETFRLRVPCDFDMEGDFSCSICIEYKDGTYYYESVVND